VSIKLGSIVVELLANTASFQSGMTKAAQDAKKQTQQIHASFEQMGDKISGALSGAFGALGQFGAVAGELARSIGESLEGIGKGTNGIGLAIGALGGLAAAGIAAAGALVELGKGGAELVEHLSQVSQKTGISVRDLQIFQAAGATVGVSLDDMVVGMKKFGQAITGFGKGAAAQSVLRELGVTAKDSKEGLLQVADAFAKMEDGPRKASDAVALFGKSGLNLIPLLNQGRDGIERWTAAVDKLGPVIGEQAVAANEKYRASVEELSLSWDKVKVQVEQSTIPALSKLTSWFANNFQSIKAGFLGGGLGAAAMLKDQQAAQQGVTDEANKTSAAKGDQLKKQEALTASEQRSFEILKAGGSAAFALEQARQGLSDATQAGLWKQASAITSLLPGLEKAAALEAQRGAEAKRSAASYAAISASFADGSFNVKPIRKAPATPHNEVESLFGPQPKKDPLEGAPDLGSGLNLDFAAGMNLLKTNTLAGQGYINDFYDQWNSKQQKTADSITESYDAQFKHLLGLYALGEVSQKDFNDVSIKLEAQRQGALKELRKDQGTSTFKDAFTDMFAQVAQSGKDFARSITSDIGDALNSLNEQLAKFVVTGKGLNLKSIGQGLETNIASSLLKKGESSLFGSLGGLLGLGGAKMDGSTQQNALWVQWATDGSLAGAGAGLGSLPLGNLSNLVSLVPGASTPGTSSGGIGGLFSGLLGGLLKFIPGLATGGNAQAGQAYIVGEKRPELFVPRSAGTVIPAVPSGSNGTTNHTTVIQNISTPDADSFRKSSTQISSAMGAAAQRGVSRNGR
jgi:hypothetical protein